MNSCRETEHTRAVMVGSVWLLAPKDMFKQASAKKQNFDEV
jgi:hypothetical protein